MSIYMESSKYYNRILILILIFALILFFLFSGKCPDVCKKREQFTDSTSSVVPQLKCHEGDIVGNMRCMKPCEPGFKENLGIGKCSKKIVENNVCVSQIWGHCLEWGSKERTIYNDIISYSPFWDPPLQYSTTTPTAPPAPTPPAPTPPVTTPPAPTPPAPTSTAPSTPPAPTPASTSTIMGIDANQNIYYANQNIKSNPNWLKSPGGLSWVSHSNGKAFGVTSAGNIYYNADYKSGNWVQVPGGLSQVSFDGYNMIVMGVNKAGNIYYANKNITTSPNWTQIPGGLTNISYSNGQAFGVNSASNIYYNADYTSGNWVQVPGELSQLSFDGYNMIIMGINSIGDIYYANKDITKNPNWTKIPGGLTNISYSNKQVIGVNTIGNIYYASDYTSGNWVQLPGQQLSQVSFEDPNGISNTPLVTPPTAPTVATPIAPVSTPTPTASIYRCKPGDEPYLGEKCLEKCNPGFQASGPQCVQLNDRLQITANYDRMYSILDSNGCDKGHTFSEGRCITSCDADTIDNGKYCIPIRNKKIYEPKYKFT